MALSSDGWDDLERTARFTALGLSDRIARSILDGQPKDVSRIDMRLTVRQRALFNQAREKRGIPLTGAIGYAQLATLAFIAYDLGIDFFEVLTGERIPEGMSPLAEGLSRDYRGMWGITGLGDHNVTG